MVPDTEEGSFGLCCITENQIQADGTIRDVEYDGSHKQFLVRTGSKLSVVNLFPIEGKDRIVGYDIPSTTKTAGYLFSYATIGGSNGISSLLETISVNTVSTGVDFNSYKDWSYNEFGIDDEEDTVFAYADNLSVCVEDDKGELSCILSGQFDDAKLLFEERLYVSVNGENPGTHIYGYRYSGAVQDYIDEINHIALSEKYFSRITPISMIDHALFVDNDGIYMDYYSDYVPDTYVPDTEDEENKFSSPSKGALTSIYTFGPDEVSRFSDIDTYKIGNDLVAIGINLQKEMVFTTLNFLETEDSEGQTWTLVPSKITSINSTSTYRVPVKRGNGDDASITKFAFYRFDKNKYTVYILDEGNVYQEELLVGSTDALVLNSNNIIASGVIDMHIDTVYRIIYFLYRNQDGNRYDLRMAGTNQLVLTTEKNPVIRGCGRQNLPGFAYGEGDSLKQIGFLDKPSFYRYTSTNCDKLAQDDENTYILNGNTLGNIKGYGLPILDKTPTTIQIGSEQLTNVYDFDVFDRTLYYVNADQRSVLRSATVDGNGTFVEGNSITLDGTTINGVVCA